MVLVIPRNSYFTVPGNGRMYGSRIYVVYSSVEVCDSLKELSKWGGHDKRLGPFLGFEFGSDEFCSALALIAAKGLAAFPKESVSALEMNDREWRLAE